MNCPFTPFMVLFCHAIATANVDDLQCLGDFVNSLQSPGESVEAAERLRRLCQVFHRVADLYINAKIQQQQQQENQHNGNNNNNNGSSNNEQYFPATPASDNHNTAAAAANIPVDDFEPYLSALGFPNAAGFLNVGDLNSHAQQNHNNNTNHPAAMGLATSLADYFHQGSTGGGHEFPPGAAAGTGTGTGGDAFSLSNWFSGNVNIMSLLETDVANIHPG